MIRTGSDVDINDSPSLPACSGCSTDSMGILSELPGHIVIDDCLDSFDIKTTRCKIGSEQVIDLTSLEIVQSVQSLIR
jgi:hypothetical protein